MYRTTKGPKTPASLNREAAIFTVKLSSSTEKNNESYWVQLIFVVFISRRKYWE